MFSSFAFYKIVIKKTNLNFLKKSRLLLPYWPVLIIIKLTCFMANKYSKFIIDYHIDVHLKYFILTLVTFYVSHTLSNLVSKLLDKKVSLAFILLGLFNNL